MSTPAERRARRERARNVGKGFVVVGALAAAVAVVAFFLPVHVTVVGGGIQNFACGGVVDAIVAGPYCAAALSDFVAATVIAGAVAVVTLAVGITVWRRAGR